MKTLFYSAAVGDDHLAMARIMVKSLRTHGDFSGDIKVFTEKPSPVDGAESIVNLDMLALHTPHLAKVFIGKTMDVSGYDRVVWIDTDVVAVRPVHWILLLEGTWLPVEMQVLQEVDKQAFSIASEPCEFGTWGLNSGLIVADAKDWNSLCQKWWDSCITTQCWKTGYCYDQPVINHLIRHGSIKASHLPEGTMHILHSLSSDITDDTTFIHSRAPLKIVIMRMVFGMASIMKS